MHCLSSLPVNRIQSSQGAKPIAQKWLSLWSCSCFSRNILKQEAVIIIPNFQVNEQRPGILIVRSGVDSYFLPSWSLSLSSLQDSHRTLLRTHKQQTGLGQTRRPAAGNPTHDLREVAPAWQLTTAVKVHRERLCSPETYPCSSEKNLVAHGSKVFFVSLVTCLALGYFQECNGLAHCHSIS